MYYLRIENNSFGFVVEDIHTITNDDVKISNEDYQKFFELQGQGKQFKLKENPTGSTLFDYVEEFIPPVDTTPQPPTQEERLKALEDLIMEVI